VRFERTFGHKKSKQLGLINSTIDLPLTVHVYQLLPEVVSKHLVRLQ